MSLTNEHADSVPQSMYMISGHSKIFVMKNGKIAKPCSENERRCYEILLQAKQPIRKYIANYYGSRTIHDAPQIADKPHSQLYMRLHSESSDSPDTLSIKPDPHEFIILENLEDGYQKPCMLDIKVGTRMYWDGAPDDKITQHEYTCRITTSSSIGLRICGMRIYNTQLNAWSYKEKRWGKRLDRINLFKAIGMFFYDGQFIRMDILPSLLSQLVELRKIVTNCNYRFWSSSLLIIYEGDTSVNPSRVDVHLIDFGNCNFNGDYSTPDEGFLFGINNLIACIELIQNGGISLSSIQKFLLTI